MMQRIFPLLCLLIIQNLIAAESLFPVKVKGTELVLNDGTERRFFLAGMVANSPRGGEQLNKFDPIYWEDLMKHSKEIGANALRWNAFLFGKDLSWDANGLVDGMQGNSLSNLKKGLDLAHENGIMVQVVLSTAHFLKYGWGGETAIVNGTSNLDRVNNNLKMFTTDAGIQAYINNVIKPMTDSIGIHPALLGFCISNEAYGMTKSIDFTDGWADVLVDEVDFAKFSNLVSGELHRRLPGVLLSISSIAEKNSIYTDEKLIQAGGDPDGTLDIYQYQYYPKNHKDVNSPILNQSESLALAGGLEHTKPAIAGEFWMHGITDRNGYLVIKSTAEAYDSLWVHGFSGGFTWSDFQYFNEWTDDIVQSIDSAYTTFNSNYLTGLDPWEFWDPDQNEGNLHSIQIIISLNISMEVYDHHLILNNLPNSGQVLLYDINGKVLYQNTINSNQNSQSIQLPLNHQNLWIQIQSTEGNFTQRINF